MSSVTPIVPAALGPTPRADSFGDDLEEDALQTDRALDKIGRTIDDREAREVAEKQVVALFAKADARELNVLLSQLDLLKTLTWLQNYWFGEKNRQTFLDNLTKNRIGEISLDNRVKLVQAIHQLGPNAGEQQALARIIVATTGLDLTRLKNAIDRQPSKYDLVHLVFDTLDDLDAQREVVFHISAEGEKLRQKKLGSKIFSDIDDTFFPNWKDKSFPNKVAYPGVKQFYAELACGPQSLSPVVGNVVFLSARGQFMETGTRETLAGHGLQNISVLTGSLLTALFSKLMAEKKLDNFRYHRMLFPEYSAIWLGDSGQMDVVVGQHMYLRQDQPEAVFIHDVVKTPSSERERYAERGIFFFDSYIEAAQIAYKKGLISYSGVLRILAAAETELDAVTYSNPEQQKARREEFLQAKEQVRP